ncbi:MAG: hypothetical protein KME35_15110 [Aphanocapsa sp. GSE-SYN-MK-11-07L]|nr:hypothetical protein [Aphanocapsa sp. GSE-SYN-MK-11-07L]
MDAFWQNLQAYYRNKRILNIEFIRAQGYYTWGRETFSETRKFGRYGFTPIWPKFLIHLTILFGLGLLVAGLNTWLPRFLAVGLALLAGWLSVEIADYIWLRYFRQIERILRTAYALLALLLLGVITLVLLQGSGERSLLKSLQAWHQQVNQDLQRKTVESVQLVGQPKGENWAFVLDSTGKLEPLTAAQAQIGCRDRFGNNWRLPTLSELKTLQPHPRLSKSTRVWSSGDQGGLMPTELVGSADRSGNSFVSYAATDLFVTLCYRQP